MVHAGLSNLANHATQPEFGAILSHDVGRTIAVNNEADLVENESGRYRKLFNCVLQLPHCTSLIDSRVPVLSKPSDTPMVHLYKTGRLE